MHIGFNEPKGENYKKLIEYAFEVCDEFLFIKHSQLSYFQSFDIITEELKEAFICCREQTEWPGTISVPSAMVYYFKCTEKSKEIIIKLTNSLFDWCAPYFPDDLCFLKNNKEWLITTAHEHISFIETNNNEEIEKIKRIMDIKY